MLTGIVIALLIAGACQAQTWSSMGIGGGGAFYSPVISPHNAQELWASSDMSGFYKSINFGEDWNLQHCENLQGGNTVSLAFTSDPDSMYAIDHSSINGLDQRRPVLSKDGGQTWSPLPDPTNGEAYTIYADPNTTTRFFLAGRDRIWYSNNCGATYQLIYTFNNNGNGIHLAGAFFDGNDIYAGTSAGLIYSSNMGTLFIPVVMNGWPAGMGMSSFAGARNGNNVRLYAALLPQADLYAGITGADFTASTGIYTCSGVSSTWTQRMTGIAASDKIFFVACPKNDVNTVYAGGGDMNNGYPVLYKSTSGAALWNQTFQTPLNTNIYTGWSGDGGDRGWGYGEYVLGLAVAPNDPDRIAFTDLGFVHVSSSGGTTWKQAYVNSNDQNAAGSNTPILKAYNGNGLENTSHWWLCKNGTQQLFSAASDINGIRSDDGGDSWRMMAATTLNTTYFVLKHPSSNVLYAATSTVHDLYQTTYLSDARIDPGQGSIRYSSNNGNNWQTLHDFNHPVIWLAIDPNNGNRMYASVIHYANGVGEGGIWKTDNLSSGSNSTWVKLSNPPRTEGHPFNLHVLNDGTVVAGYCARRDAAGAFTASSGVFVLPSGASVWMDRSDAGMQYYTKDVVIDPSDAQQNTWYACVWSGWGGAPNGLGGLYKTTDRGLTWNRVFNGADRVTSLSFDPSVTGAGWLSTETEGLWRCTGLNTPAPVITRDHSFPFRHPERIFCFSGTPAEVWVTTFGGGLFKSSVQSAGLAEAAQEDALQFENPTDGNFGLQLKKSFDRIWITDILNRYIQEVPATGGAVSLRVSGKGMYFIRAQSTGKILTYKLIVR